MNTAMIPTLSPTEKRALHRAYARAIRDQSVLHPVGRVKTRLPVRWVSQRWYRRFATEQPTHAPMEMP